MISEQEINDRVTRIIRIANKFASNQLKGVWYNDSCIRCGACCVYFIVNEIGKDRGQRCSNLEFERENESKKLIAKCNIHENKPEVCKSFFCNYPTLPNEINRHDLMLYAIGLGTKKNDDFLKAVNEFT